MEIRGIGGHRERQLTLLNPLVALCSDGSLGQTSPRWQGTVRPLWRDSYQKGVKSDDLLSNM